MQACTTVDKGHRFRCALEARWAVFPDALGARWTCKAEDFDVHSRRYTADFHARDWLAWIEIVNGAAPNTTDRTKCRALTQATCRPVQLVNGEPLRLDRHDNYYITLFINDDCCDQGNGWDLHQAQHYKEEY